MDNPVLAESRFSFAQMQKQLLAGVAIFLAASIPVHTASAQNRDRSGKEVVDAVQAGKDGAKGILDYLKL